MVTTNSATSGESTWCETSHSALRSNARALKDHVGDAVRLGAVVKSNAYGHGLAIAAKALREGGADWLIVNSAAEALELRRVEPAVPIYVCGPVLPTQAPEIIDAQARVVVYSWPQVQALAESSKGQSVPLHVKIETGNQRQGLAVADAVALALKIAATDGVTLEGIATHYADIEDTTDHGFARSQSEGFAEAAAAFRQAGLDPGIRHASNSAATILYPETHGDMVRVGIAAYGHWPSQETFATALSGGTRFVPELMPGLAWRARVAQVKDVPAGAFIGYGRTYRTTHASRIAVIPVGYHEGYDRRLSNIAHVLVHGVRAPVRGRVCMNMMMVDVTDIPEAAISSVVTLLGRDGDEVITAEQIGRWMGTINYEVLARIHPQLPRISVD